MKKLQQPEFDMVFGGFNCKGFSEWIDENDVIKQGQIVDQKLSSEEMCMLMVCPIFPNPTNSRIDNGENYYIYKGKKEFCPAVEIVSGCYPLNCYDS